MVAIIASQWEGTSPLFTHKLYNVRNTQLHFIWKILAALPVRFLKLHFGVSFVSPCHV